MKAATVAAECGHEITLIESAERLGGQVLMAQLLPKREEFGGIVSNLERELRDQNIKIVCNKTVDREYLEEHSFDYTILASGSKPKLPQYSREGSLPVLSYEDVLLGKPVGHSIVVYDWRSDWVGIGVSEKLAANGCYVRLAVNGLSAGGAIQSYVRDDALARLYSAKVEIITFSRLFGVDDKNVYLSHTVSQEPIILENVDTAVIVPAMEAVTDLVTDLEYLDQNYTVIGDAASPRTVEEAVYEGLKSAVRIL